jgi:adenylosuccinate lyase
MTEEKNERLESPWAETPTKVSALPETADGVEEQESVAKSLIEKLGLYEEPPVVQVSEGDEMAEVDSE